MKGTSQRVLFNHYAKNNKNILLGKTDNNRVVEINTKQDLLNKFANVRIVDIKDKNLQAELLIK